MESPELVFSVLADWLLDGDPEGGERVADDESPECEAHGQPGPPLQR